MSTQELINDALLFGATVDKSGAGQRIGSENGEHERCDAFAWLHFCSRHRDTRRRLESLGILDDIAIDALLAEDSRPRALIRENTLLLDLRALNLWPNERPEDMISFRMWTDGKTIVSARTRDIRSVDEMQKHIENGNGPKRVGEFITQIVGKVFARIEPCIDTMEDEIGRFEEQIAADEPEPVGESIGRVRTTNAILQRYIVPQERSLDLLINSRLEWLETGDIERLTESHDRVIRYVETLRDLRERLKIINEELGRASDAEVARTSYMFALAATIFLPLSFLTGLMGVNLGGMPGSQSETAFWIFGGICFAIIVMQILIFRKMRWF